MLLKNGKIFTGRGTILESTDILIERGQIKQIGKNLKPQKNEEVIDLTGLMVFPGFIDAHTHLGVYAEPVTWASEDGNEMSDPVTPQVRAIDAINCDDMAFADAVTAGITSVFTGPGSGNIIGGQSAFIKTAGSIIADERAVMQFCGLKAALGENPKRVYGQKSKLPMTRMGNAAVMREAFVSAQNYLKKSKTKDKKPDADLKMEALIQVLEKKVPLRCHAHRADDIATIVRIKEEFGFNLVVEHATEGHKIAGFLANKKIPCVIGPSLTARVKEELKEKSFKTPKLLFDAGVFFAIITDAPVIPVQYLPEMAGFAIREGLPWDEALKAITINAAEICGVSSRVGSLEIGKDADITVYSGDPFTIEGRCEMTFVNGECVYKRGKG